ncbi:DegT/DnrJ/EryC1/StrS family aminotransferase [Candidatus Poribacteria bacterium]|nr:DegT/DnrJ/EryC1/StrS family aminotransferase [Candidatus Poribacteria bacterium]
MEWKVPLTTTTIGAEEEAAALRVLRRGWLSMGPEVEAFEHEFAQALGCNFAVATANATDGLALAYDAMAVAPGDEVIMPALTFVASMNVAFRRNAAPVLVDVESEDDLTMSVRDLESKLTSRTRLIVTMPYGGFAPRMDEIMSLARNRRIPVLEDACHGILGTYKSQHLGTMGAAGVFSFYGNKNMTTGEGGMLVTNERAIAERVRLMRNHGMTRTTFEHYQGATGDYDVRVAGHNFRMDELRAAVGREQLRKLPEANRRRAEVAAAIRDRITDRIPEARFPFHEFTRGQSSHHLLVMLLPPEVDRTAFMRTLAARGVQTSIHYKPLHRFSHTAGMWQDLPGLPVLEGIEKQLVTLPLGPGFTEEQITLLVNAVADAIR